MNNRDYKKFVPGGIYHVFNRGNDKRLIFESSEDYEFFLLRLNQNLSLAPISPQPGHAIKPLPTGAFDLIGYCLMPNHFHFLLKQNTEIPITKLISKICTSYAKYFNKKYLRVGTLFQDQFKSVPITTAKQFETVVAYINDNPVKAGLVKSTQEYPYCKMVPIMQIC